jgi:hypothetical protein
MKNNKKASVLIYAIILTAIALSLGVIIMNNSSTLISNNAYYNIEKDFYNRISEKTKIFKEKILETNSD